MEAVVACGLGSCPASWNSRQARHALSFWLQSGALWTVYLSIRPSTLCPPIHPLSTHPSFGPSIFTTASPFLLPLLALNSGLMDCPSIRLFIHPSVRPALSLLSAG